MDMNRARCMRHGGAKETVYEDRYRRDCSARATVGGRRFRLLGTSSPSLQSDPSRQGEPLTFHIWFRVPFPEILWMHPALNADAYAILTNQAEPSRQAGAFGATKLKVLSNFLDGESVYHSLNATHTGMSITSQEGGCWPLFSGITSAITDAIRLAPRDTVSCSGEVHSPNCGRACVCRPGLDQGGIRPGGGTRQKGER